MGCTRNESGKHCWEEDEGAHTRCCYCDMFKPPPSPLLSYDESRKALATQLLQNAVVAESLKLRGAPRVKHGSRFEGSCITPSTRARCIDCDNEMRLGPPDSAPLAWTDPLAWTWTCSRCLGKPTHTFVRYKRMEVPLQLKEGTEPAPHSFGIGSYNPALTNSISAYTDKQIVAEYERRQLAGPSHVKALKNGQEAEASRDEWRREATKRECENQRLRRETKVGIACARALEEKRDLKYGERFTDEDLLCADADE